MRFNTPTEFMEAELKPGTVLIDDNDDKWLVMDKISYTKVGSGLIRLRDGLYHHALHMPHYPLYESTIERFLRHVITWLKQRFINE